MPRLAPRPSPCGLLLFIAVALLGLASGCGASSGPLAVLPDGASTLPDDAGLQSDDAGLPADLDASLPDAGGPDAAIDSDAGPTDASEPADAGDAVDAGEVFDAGDVLDAGSPDAGSTPDAGTPPQVLTPASGTRLKAKIETFTWTAGADEYWLDIGTTLGATDLYRSPSLGTATSQEVRDLPLDGNRLYVRLRARFGANELTADAEYDASFRKGLCVIADFADTRLEEWTGAGMKTVGDVDAQLRLMETHWNWLSRGKEVAHWDRIRVTLTQPRSNSAFNGWVPYREEVARLVKQQVAVADYDVDRDGVIDGIWIIAPNKGASFDWLIGGASRNNGANIFVDGQSGQAVVVHATGCFNHEFGHCVGLPDLYGTYGSVPGLSLMASPWEDPQNDFCAFDRVKLGWSKPLEVTQTSRGIVLHSALTTLESVRISTADPSEYFLLEYRQRPASGFGMYGSGEGLAVYHVFEPATSQEVNPPLLKLEPADGAILADTTPEAQDFLTPGNLAMQMPFELKSYLGDDVVARLENLSAPSSDSLQFDVVVTSAAANPPNLLADGDFEAGYAGWTNGGFKPWAATFSWDALVGHDGSAHSLSIDSPSVPNDVEWHRRVTGLVPRGRYLLCAWIKGLDVRAFDGAETGGNIGISGTFDHTSGGMGTFGWTEHCMIFNPAQSYADIACRMGGFGSTVTGKVWCDDVRLSPLRSAF